MLKLYNFPLSGNCYKIRLFLSMIQKEYQTIEINLGARENTQPSFLKLNPRGQVPVIDDEGQIIWDSMAILIYLARRYAEPSWFPDEAMQQAQVMQWLAVSENEVLYGLARARARAIRLFNRPFDPKECHSMGISALTLLDQQLSRQNRLATDQPTIADIACYPYVILAPEGEIDLAPYPFVLSWIDRIQAIPGYIAMTGPD